MESLIFFGLAIGLTAFNVMNIVVAFLLCVLAFISIKVLNGNLYRNIEWPVVVMLAAMIPLGQALETSGISLNIANFISTTTDGLALPWLQPVAARALSPTESGWFLRSSRRPKKLQKMKCKKVF